MRNEPIAFLITFRCYGTWLHGDARGSVDPQHADPHEAPLERDDLRAAFERREMREPPVRLSATLRTAIADAVAEACSYRGWRLHALNVRTNHVHMVVSAEKSPETVMNVLKGRATRLLREAHLIAPTARLWSRHGSTIHLWSEHQVAAACEYVIERQD